MGYIVHLMISLVADSVSIFLNTTTGALNDAGLFLVNVLIGDIVMTIEESIINLTPVIVAEVSREVIEITGALIPNIAALANILGAP